MALEDELERERRHCRFLESEVVNLGGDAVALEARDRAKKLQRRERGIALVGVPDGIDDPAPANDADSVDLRGGPSLGGKNEGGTHVTTGMDGVAVALGETPKQVNVVAVHPQGEGRRASTSDIADADSGGSDAVKGTEETVASTAVGPSALDGVLVKLVSFIPVP